MCLTIALALAAHVAFGSDTGAATGTDRTDRTAVIVPVTVPVDGVREMPVRHVVDDAPQPFAHDSCQTEALLLPRTILLRSGSTPSSAPRRCLLITLWSTASS